MKSKKTFRLNVLLLVNLLLFNPIIIHPSNAESFPVIYFGLYFSRYFNINYIFKVNDQKRACLFTKHQF